ncbi:MAG: dipeptidase [Deltaproteobacteria bacterium]|nr:dipeptidase [Deltaproteobacteria bacterium]MBW2399364.1 dipeptidase [Deltaproteobacteria bacterium]MBW2664921.1 dipeptidase [Deltaproteobacteria bacterium]
MRRLLWRLLIVVAAGVALFFWFGANLERFVNRVDAVVLPGVTEEALRIHDESLVVDLHADSLLFDRDLSVRSDIGHVDLPRLREGGVALQMFTAATRMPFTFDIHEVDANGSDILTVGFVAQRAPMAGMGPRDRALHQAGRLGELIESSEGAVMPVRTRADLDAAIAAHRENSDVVGVIFGIEGAHALEGDLDNLPVLFDAGVRMIGLAHFFDNEFAGSAHGIEKGGLSDLGRELIARMEAMGIAIDLAHLSPTAIDDVLAIANKPLLVSHTGVRATCDSPRNLSDEHIRAIANTGGAIGIGYFELAICGTNPTEIVAAMKHVIELVGDEHVALGSDYDGGTEVAFDTSQLRALTQQMLDDGLSEESIRKIAGENAIRVLRRTLPRR